MGMAEQLPVDGCVKAWTWGVGDRRDINRFKGTGWGTRIIGKWDTVTNATMEDEVEMARRMCCTTDEVVAGYFRPYMFAGVVSYDVLVALYGVNPVPGTHEPNTKVRPHLPIALFDGSLSPYFLFLGPRDNHGV